MEYGARIGSGDCPIRLLALAEPDDSISAACVKATKNRSRHRDADRWRLHFVTRARSTASFAQNVISKRRCITGQSPLPENDPDVREAFTMTDASRNLPWRAATEDQCPPTGGYVSKIPPNQRYRPSFSTCRAMARASLRKKARCSSTIALR